MQKVDDDWLLNAVEKLAEHGRERGLSEAALRKVIKDSINASMPGMAMDVVTTLHKNLYSMITEHRHLQNEFLNRLQFRWFEGFDLLEAIIVGLFETGEEINEDLRKTLRPESKYLVEVLTRFHARSIRIGQEILCLLRNGYPDGAFTRWRSIHEIAVLSYFIMDHGNSLAKLFLEYSEVERYQEAVLLERHAKKLGIEPTPKADMDEISKEYERLVGEHSKDFTEPYGWTYQILPKQNRNLRGIETSIDLSYLRPFYAMASRSIHSSPKGIFWDLGLSDSADSPILLAGPTNNGMVDPAQNTAISLLQVTSNLFMLSPSMNRLIGLKAIELLIQEMIEKLLKVQDQMDAEEGRKDNKVSV